MISRFLRTYLTKISFFSYLFRSTIILSTSAIKILLEHLNYPSSMIRSDPRIRPPAAAAGSCLLCAACCWVLGTAVWVLGIFFFYDPFSFLSFPFIRKGRMQFLLSRIKNLSYSHYFSFKAKSATGLLLLICAKRRTTDNHILHHPCNVSHQHCSCSMLPSSCNILQLAIN